MRLMHVAGIVLMALLVAGCRSTFGVEAGGFGTLEADLAAQRAEIDSVLNDALDSYDILGVRVDVAPCDPISEWKGGTVLVVLPTEGSVSDGVDAMVSALEDRGLEVETIEPVGSERLRSYSVELTGFDRPLWFWWGTDPTLGIAVSLGGGCYDEGDIGVGNPGDLAVQEGVTSIVHE